MIVKVSFIGSIVLYLLVFLISIHFVDIRYNKITRIAAISLLPFLIAGFRYNVGWDYGSYLRGYDLFDASRSFISYIQNFKLGDSLGLDLVLMLTKSLNSKFLFFALTSALCFIPVLIYLLDEWDDDKQIIKLSIFIMFFTLYFTGLSAIKQGIAMGFCFLSLKYAHRRNLLKFCLCVFIGFLFHSSALVFLPVYFIAADYLSGYKKLITIGTALIFCLFIDKIFILIGGKFESYAGSLLISNNYTFYLMFFWLVVFLIFRKQLLQLDDRNDFLILMYAVGVIFMCLGFTNAFVKRIASYYEMVQILLIPQLCFVFNERSQKIFKIMIAIYFVTIFVYYCKGGTHSNMSPIPYSFIFGENIYGK